MAPQGPRFQEPLLPQKRQASSRQLPPLRPLWVVTLLQGTAHVVAMIPAFSLHFRELALADGMDAAATAAALGRLKAVRSMVEFAATPTLAFWSDRTGRRPVMMLCSMAACIQLALFALSRSLWEFGVVYVAFGLLSDSNGALESTCIADATPPGAPRSAAFGRLYLVIGVVMVVGPAIGGYLAGLDSRAPFIAGAAMYAGGVLYIILQLPEYSAEKRSGGGRALQRSSSFRTAERVLKVSPSTGWFVAASVICALGMGAFSAAQVLWLHDVFGFDSGSVGRYLSLSGLLLMASQGVVLPRLLKVFSGRETRLAQLGLMLTALKLLALGLAPSRAWLWIIQLASVGSSCSAAPLASLCTKAVPESHQGALTGLMSAASTAAQVAGSMLGSQVFAASLRGDAPGGSFLYVAAAAYCVAFACVSRGAFLERRPHPKEEDVPDMASGA